MNNLTADDKVLINNCLIREARRIRNELRDLNNKGDLTNIDYEYKIDLEIELNDLINLINKWDSVIR